MRHRGHDVEQPRAGRQGSDLRPQRLHLQLLPGGARRLRGRRPTTSDWPTNHHDSDGASQVANGKQGPELSERMVSGPRRLRREDRGMVGAGARVVVDRARVVRSVQTGDRRPAIERRQYREGSVSRTL